MLDRSNLAGQWVGSCEFEGGSTELSLLNIEHRDPTFAQFVRFPNDGYNRRIASEGEFVFSSGVVKGSVGNDLIFDFEAEEYILARAWPSRKVENTTYTGRFEDGLLLGEFVNNVEQHGKFCFWPSYSEFVRDASNANAQEIPAQGPLTWDEYKQRITQFRGRNRVYYRGQHSNTFPLRTLFHRAGRNNLRRYVEEDIPRLRHRVNASSSYYYKGEGDDFLALLSLAQHHGFPTPLLDWTLSPYVAAFFAFDCLNDKLVCSSDDSPTAVRVYAFDDDRWRKTNRPTACSLQDPWPDFSFKHPAAHNNPRYYPQQSIAAVSNVDDIEGFIRGYEAKEQVQCLFRFDIRADQRQEVIEDLHFMGITASTLFPGFEGICKDLRSQMFDPP